MRRNFDPIHKELKTPIYDGVLTANRYEVNVKQDLPVHKQSIKSTLLVFFMLAILFVFIPLTKGDQKDSNGQDDKVKGPTLFFHGSRPSSAESVTVTAPAFESQLNHSTEKRLQDDSV